MFGKTMPAWGRVRRPACYLCLTGVCGITGTQHLLFLWTWADTTRRITVIVSLCAVCAMSSTKWIHTWGWLWQAMPPRKSFSLLIRLLRQPNSNATFQVPNSIPSPLLWWTIRNASPVCLTTQAIHGRNVSQPSIRLPSRLWQLQTIRMSISHAVWRRVWLDRWS